MNDPAFKLFALGASHDFGDRVGRALGVPLSAHEEREAVGVDRVVTLDVHNLASFQNAFRCRTDHLEARPLFIRSLIPLLGDEDVAVVSPDVGGIKRAEQFRQSLGRALERPVPTAFMEKQRAKSVVSGEALVGDVQGKVAIIVDDLISTGTTLLRAVKACRRLGARQVYAVASHGVFMGEANRVLADEDIEKVIVTDTLPPIRLDPALAQSMLIVLEAAALFAQAIQRIHRGGSIVELLEI